MIVVQIITELKEPYNKYGYFRPTYLRVYPS